MIVGPPNKPMQTDGRFAAIADRQRVGRTEAVCQARRFPLSTQTPFADGPKFSSWMFASGGKLNIRR